MKTLTKKVCERIYSINVYDCKAYIYFMLILLFCMLERIVTQVMVNYYGYVEGSFYERSSELIAVSMIFALVKINLGFMLGKVLVENPVQKEIKIELPPICKIKASNFRALLALPAYGMSFYFWITMLYDTVNYVLITFIMK